MLELVVEALNRETSRIRSVRLVRPDRSPLPNWQAGAHIDLALPSGETRSYSLVKTLADNASQRTSTFRIGVRREDPSFGGSEFVHGLKPGDRVTVSAPKNNFAIEPGGDAVVLLAGGIGITPLMAMATELSEQGRRFRLIYAGRERDDLAFLSELQTCFPSQLELHEDVRSGILDIVAVMRALDDGSPLYICGPLSMIEAAIAASRALGWPDGRLHFEIFNRPASDGKGDGFDVVLARSGRQLRVPADKSILQVLLDEGVEWPHDCKLGDCGVCQAAVIDGTPDHRDFYLSDKERASNKLIQVCVSRAKSSVLRLDI